MMCETCWVGGNFAKVAGRNVDEPEPSIVSVGASFRAVERELGRELE